ncbi:MAG: hypothetical protein IPL05_08835 [Betaproteobacteria bacterium]|nr:hypothetical protein [Betaproteobacteria bacterium]
MLFVVGQELGDQRMRVGQRLGYGDLAQQFLSALRDLGQRLGKRRRWRQLGNSLFPPSPNLPSDHDFVRLAKAAHRKWNTCGLLAGRDACPISARRNGDIGFPANLAEADVRKTKFGCSDYLGLGPKQVVEGLSGEFGRHDHIPSA